MSRSYRKPYVVDGYGSRWKAWAKRNANKKVRRTMNIPSGKAYRKVSDSYNICDYKWLEDFKPSYFWVNGQQAACDIIPEWKVKRK